MVPTASTLKATAPPGAPALLSGWLVMRGADKMSTAPGTPITARSCPLALTSFSGTGVSPTLNGVVTASPIATVIPFNVWPTYVAGLVVGTIALFATEMDAISFFYKAILFNFYGIIAVLFTYSFALDLNPFVFGKMKRAIQRELENPLAQKILAGNYNPGDKITVRENQGVLEFDL